MVRVKHRYLLVQILTPSAPSMSANRKASDSQELQHTSPLLIHVHSPTPDTVTTSLLLSHIRNNLSYLFGDHGAALASTSLLVKYWSPATSTFIVRCKRECLQSVWAAITWCTSVPVPEEVQDGFRDGGRAGRGRSRDGRAGSGPDKGVPGRGKVKEKEVVMQVVRVSGTIRKCEEEAIRRARMLCGKVKGMKLAMEAGATLSTVQGADGVTEDNDVGLYTEPEAVQSDSDMSEDGASGDHREDGDDND